MLDKINVYIWGRKAGYLVSARDGYRMRICFYFDADFAKDGWDIAPLRAPLRCRAAQTGMPFYGETEKEFGDLPSFIADSLPDRWGNMLFARWAAASGIRRRDLSPLDRLAYTGRRGMGALEFIPVTDEKMESPFKVKIEELSALARTAMDEAGKFRAEMDDAGEFGTGTGADILIENLFKVGTSAGGRRPKAVVNVNWESGEFLSGQVPTDLPWFTPMIVKFDEHSEIPTTRIEYSYYLMALDAGLRMMPSHLSVGRESAHFMTERFDRNWNEKLHVQTLSAMHPGACSYEDLFDTACRIGVPPKEMRQLFLMMTMNVLTGNVDDHNKNFSFMMDRDRQWHAAPAYDFTFAVDLSAPGYMNRHSMTVNGKNDGITQNDLMAVAKAYNVKGAAGLVRQASEVAADYRRYADAAGVGEDWTERIRREIDGRIGVVMKC